jgi:hypothetical protein
VITYPTALVTEIPTPWTHPFGTVVGVEYPADRPMVVDLVLADGLRTVETRTALYAQLGTGTWDLARHILPAGQLAEAKAAAEDRAYTRDSDSAELARLADLLATTSGEDHDAIAAVAQTIANRLAADLNARGWHRCPDCGQWWDADAGEPCPTEGTLLIAEVTTSAPERNHP